jgi:hypothetical protein
MAHQLLRLLLIAGCVASLLPAQRSQMPTRRIMPPEIVPPEGHFQDVVKVDPVHYRVEHENSQMRVLRLNLKGDESTPIHDDRAGLLVCLTECHIRFQRLDGKVQDVHLEAGQTRWVWDDARSHTNLSPHPLELLYIETKIKPRA